jgi:hypothetical protein
MKKHTFVRPNRLNPKVRQSSFGMEEYITYSEEKLTY